MLENKRLVRFLIVGAGIFIGWYLLYYIILPEKNVLDAPLIRLQSYASVLLLNLLGYDATYVDISSVFTCSVAINNQASVKVGGECGGLELLVLFVGFVLAFGGNWRKMLWFIPAGILLIIFLNILRIASLAAINLHYPEYLDFNHKYTFVIIVYAAIFGMWWYWVNQESETLVVVHEEK